MSGRPPSAQLRHPTCHRRSLDQGGRGLAPRCATGYTARLTIDVTPELRGRIKVAAFQCGTTVADMLRDLFAREFPADDGGER